MPRSTRPLRQVQPYELANNSRYGKYYYESFRGGEQPLWFLQTSQLPVMPTAPVAQGTTVHGITPAGRYWQLFTTTAQSLLPTGSAGNGLEFGGDEVDNEALEMVPGGNSSSSRLAFTIGTDSDFFFRARYKLTDVTGFDQAILAGFRKQEAFAVPTSILNGGDGIYTDFAGIGFADTTGTDIFTVSDLNNSGATVATDTGFNATNAQVLDLECRVIGRKAFYFINGTRLGNPVTKDGDGTSIASQTTLTGATFTFDSGDVVVPVIFARHDAGVSNEAYLVEVECGHLADVGLDPNAL